ncbi:hypothetical protein E2C01_001685 [Portunus trituberculatus]|uniref:Uncharacterized protein n=1 Tax=Portunus trituberculatus TaxID=210409 RepID=A0A5B7CN44_PORTR|nr:hypothetical protein [Portunus trituberculatus]
MTCPPQFMSSALTWYTCSGEGRGVPGMGVYGAAREGQLIVRTPPTTHAAESVSRRVQEEWKGYKHATQRFTRYCGSEQQGN